MTDDKTTIVPPPPPSGSNAIKPRASGCIDPAYRTEDGHCLPCCPVFREMNRKPYKCPICDGTGKILNQGKLHETPFFDSDDEDFKGCFDECSKCKGTGIIWGG